PYPYRSEDVSYASCDSIQVAGTLTIPRGKGPFPAALIISGTGKQDRDGTFSGHKPFFKIADYLTRQGFVVLRADDRGTGETNGIYEEATTSDFARDAQAGIDYLKQRPEVDAKRIGVIGHSEGGQVALMLGPIRGCGIRYLPTAGVGVDGLQILKLQNDAILRTTRDDRSGLISS
ncbi:MAG: alpha/beta hydrolase family protein, partial [Butyricimonas faecalis]